MSAARIRRLGSAAVAGTQATSRVLAAAAALIVFVMLLTTVADIVLRHAIQRPIPGVFEYSEVGLVIIVFLGLPYTMQVGGHVVIDSLTSRLPERWRRGVEAVALAVTLPFVVWLAVASVGVAVESFQSGEVKYGVIQAPVWPARIAVPVGSALLAAEIAIALGRCLRPHATVRRDPPSEPA